MTSRRAVVAAAVAGLGGDVGRAGEADASGCVPTEPDGGDARVAGGLEGERGKQRDAEPGRDEGLGDDVVVGAVADVGPEAVAGGGGREVRATAWAAGDPALVGGVGEVGVGPVCEWVSGGQYQQHRVVEQRCLRRLAGCVGDVVVVEGDGEIDVCGGRSRRASSGSASVSRMSRPGARCRSRAMAAGTKVAHAEGNAARRTRPARRSVNALRSARAARRRVVMASACIARDRPASVRVTPRELRMTSAQPVSRSSRLTCWATAGCVQPSVCAAAANDPERATSAKTTIWRGSSRSRTPSGGFGSLSTPATQAQLGSDSPPGRTSAQAGGRSG